LQRIKVSDIVARMSKAVSPARHANHDDLVDSVYRPAKLTRLRCCYFF
jgi:hypothetical protein